MTMQRILMICKLMLLSVLLLSLSGCISLSQTGEREDGEAAIRASDYKTAISPKDRRMAEAYVSYIVKHYSISRKGARRIVEAVMAESQKHKVDRSLITAVIAVESRFHPYALSKGNAEGLMQVIPRWHPEKMARIGGEEKIVDTRGNICAGTMTLKEYLVRHDHNVELALQQYNGSLNDRGRRYSRRVLAEKNRIDRWLAARG